MPQKRVGWYLSMSGVYAANSRRASEHVLKYALVAILQRSSPLPYSLRAKAISLFAALQVSVYHGARVFPHLFGFFGTVTFISLTTPALIASCNRNSSTYAALSSLLTVVFSTNVLNLSVNSALLVYSVHVCADWA
jgi:hypothetical protein